MAKTQDTTGPPDPDLLAAVVLQTLVSAGAGGLTSAELGRACERDPTNPDEVRELEAALDVLLADELATRQADHYLPTRAAIRAAELSF